MGDAAQRLRRLVVAALIVACGAGCRTSYDPLAVEAVDTLAKGDVEAARTLYEAGAEVDARFQDGMTALMILSSSALTEAVDLLLDLGADPNLRSRDGATALMYAARRGRLDNVRRLLAAGADPRAVDRTGRSASELAAVEGHATVARLLEETTRSEKAR